MRSSILNGVCKRWACASHVWQSSSKNTTRHLLTRPLSRLVSQVSSVTQTTATERESLCQLLQEKDQLQREQEDRIKNLTKLLVTASNVALIPKVTIHRSDRLRVCEVRGSDCCFYTQRFPSGEWRGAANSWDLRIWWRKISARLTWVLQSRTSRREEPTTLCPTTERVRLLP